MKVRAPTPDYVVNMAEGEDPAHRLARAVDDARWVLRQAPKVGLAIAIIFFALGFGLRGCF